MIRILNQLKRKRRLRGYAIFGAVAASYYMAPIYTDDIDVLVLADTDQEYISIWRELSQHAERTKGFGFIIAKTETQILPTSIDPLYENALRKAQLVRVGGVTTRIVDREHLILMALKANRSKDRFRALMLLEEADMVYLHSLLQRFDKDGSLEKGLKTLR